ncbi:MAG: NUDIX hydrolase [Lachnospiraceae bacterium]|nr:NUDIX hydrolase [Lachnospiraceae bacterium]
MNYKELPRPERVGRTLVHNGSVVDFYADTMRLPDGTEETFDFISHKGAAAVVPVLDDGRILMVRQYRNALDRYTLEIPAGGRATKDEPTFDCACRELEEETGYRAAGEDVTFLFTMFTTVAFCNEQIDIYLARNLVKADGQHLDDDEYIDVYAFTIDELIRMIRDGEIVDGKTIAALMTYHAMKP